MSQMSVSSSRQQNLHDYQLDFSAFVGVHKVVQANDKSECEQVMISEIGQVTIKTLKSLIST